MDVNVAGLSSEEKDRVLEALLQRLDPQVVNETVEAVTGAHVNLNHVPINVNMPPVNPMTMQHHQPMNVNMQPGNVNGNFLTNHGHNDAIAPSMAQLTVPEPAGQMQRLYASPPRQAPPPPPQRQVQPTASRSKKRQRNPGIATDSNLKHLPKNQLWQARFEELCRYKEEFGTVQVSFIIELPSLESVRLPTGIVEAKELLWSC